jgi:hypothetical protein
MCASYAARGIRIPFTRAAGGIGVGVTVGGGKVTVGEAGCPGVSVARSGTPGDSSGAGRVPQAARNNKPRAIHSSFLSNIQQIIPSTRQMNGCEGAVKLVADFVYVDYNALPPRFAAGWDTILRT